MGRDRFLKAGGRLRQRAERAGMGDDQEQDAVGRPTGLRGQASQKSRNEFEKWLEVKEKDREAEARARQKAAEPPKEKKAGFLSKLIERAHKPL